MTCIDGCAPRRLADSLAVMPYGLESALPQWRDGERRVAAAEPRHRAALEDAVDAVVSELRRRLGAFGVHELADLYGAGTDRIEDLARARGAGLEAAAVVDAGFARYARQASDFAGGRTRHVLEGR